MLFALGGTWRIFEVQRISSLSLRKLNLKLCVSGRRFHKDSMDGTEGFKPTFFKVEEKVNFPKEEERILAYWKSIDAFKTSMQLSEGKPCYTFYDGPPFATGLPHYGHILAGCLKDVVTRYAYQTGHHVDRRFGWDCHGLPVEHEIDKSNNITHISDVHKMGIGVYNEMCRSIVMKYSSEWRSIVSRTGRWIDFDNDYKTMDTNFMESLWWIFKQFFNKKLIYKGFQVMPYSPSCTTPVSNFEANLNYKTVSDPSIFVAFSCPERSFDLVIWTTTPWTLPSNLALCVNPDFYYLVMLNSKTNRRIVLAECRLDYFRHETKLGDELAVMEKLKGTDLEGLKYEPLFQYFWDSPSFTQKQRNISYVILCDKMVTDDAGTGIVHMAPYYGEEDMRVCREAGLVPQKLNLP